MPKIIAEIGPNHNGSLKIARKMIHALAKSGADFIKFQLAVPEEVYSKDAFKARYQKKNDNSATAIEMSRRYQFSFDDHKTLYEECKKNSTKYACTAFDLKSLKYIDKNFNLPFFKIASGEAFSLDMLEYIANRNRSVLLSTGMTSFSDIEKILNILNKRNKKNITLMHCTSNYPALPKDAHLNLIGTLRKRFGYPVGFSDHTKGVECAIAASALGAVIIEKHVTMDNDMEGPDHAASLEIARFSEFVKSIKKIEEALGKDKKTFSKDELEIKKSSRKSIVSKKDLKKNHVITCKDICFKRPGTGILPIEVGSIINKKVKRTIKKDRVIKPGDVL